jgi:hypothetical protein
MTLTCAHSLRKFAFNRKVMWLPDASNIPDILAQAIGAVIASGSCIVLVGILAAIAARYSDTIHRGLCAVYRSIDS